MPKLSTKKIFHVTAAPPSAGDQSLGSVSRSTRSQQRLQNDDTASLSASAHTVAVAIADGDDIYPRNRMKMTPIRKKILRKKTKMLVKVRTRIMKAAKKMILTKLRGRSRRIDLRVSLIVPC